MSDFHDTREPDDGDPTEPDDPNPDGHADGPTDEAAAGDQPDSPADDTDEPSVPASDDSPPVLSGSAPTDNPERTRFVFDRGIVFGKLIVHYPERDVAFELDARTAMRMLATWRGAGGFEDPLAVNAASGRRPWVGADVAKALAVSWEPQLREARAVFDPPA